MLIFLELIEEQVRGGGKPPGCGEVGCGKVGFHGLIGLSFT